MFTTHAPYAFIDGAFSKYAEGALAAKAGDSSPWLADISAGAAAALATEAALAQVPALTAKAFNAGSIQPNTVVRYVGMVQDVLEPEIYASVIRTTSGPAGA